MQGYVEAALWTDLQWPHEGEGDPPESGGGNGIFDLDNLDADSFLKVQELCIRFLKENKEDIEDYVEACESGGRLPYDPSQGTPLQYAGHDLWLSSCGHGTGFWDRSLDELGNRLHAAASKSPWSDFEGSALPYVVNDTTVSFI